MSARICGCDPSVAALGCAPRTSGVTSAPVGRGRYFKRTEDGVHARVSSPRLDRRGGRSDRAPRCGGGGARRRHQPDARDLSVGRGLPDRGGPPRPRPGGEPRRRLVGGRCGPVEHAARGRADCRTSGRDPRDRRPGGAEHGNGRRQPVRPRPLRRSRAGAAHPRRAARLRDCRRRGDPTDRSLLRRLVRRHAAPHRLADPDRDSTCRQAPPPT